MTWRPLWAWFIGQDPTMEKSVGLTTKATMPTTPCKTGALPGNLHILIDSTIFKLFSTNALKNYIIDLKILNSELSTIVSKMFPIFEIIIGGLLILYSNFILVNILAIILTMTFLIINLIAINRGEVKDCHCFGNVIKTKMGYGGVIQSTLLVLSLLPNFFNYNLNLIHLVNILELYEVLASLSISLVWGFSLIVFRIAIERVFESSKLIR